MITPRYSHMRTAIVDGVAWYFLHDALEMLCISPGAGLDAILAAAPERYARDDSRRRDQRQHRLINAATLERLEVYARQGGTAP